MRGFRVRCASMPRLPGAATHALAAALLCTAALMGASNNSWAATPPDLRNDVVPMAPQDRVTAESRNKGPRGSEGVDNDFDVQVVYFLPKDAPNRDRSALMWDAARRVQQQWAGWGWTFKLNRNVITLKSQKSCAYFSSFDRLWNETRSKLERRAQYFPNVKYAVFGECTSAPGAAAQAAQPGNVSLYYAYVVDGIGLNDNSDRNLSDVGAIGHELGHNFGLFHENCNGQDPDSAAVLADNGLPSGASLGPMCNGGNWPNVSPAPYQNELVFRYGCAWLSECVPQYPGWVPAGTVGVGSGKGRTRTSESSGLCVDAAGADTTSGAGVVQWTCIGSSNQRLQARPTTNGRVHLVFAHSGYCLNPVNRSSLAGARMVQWPCSGDSDTQWLAREVAPSVFEYVNARSGMCLDVPNGSADPGRELIQWPCTGEANQRWAVSPSSR
jgi:Ricin-type beta-trefoil lectin domain